MVKIWKCSFWLLGNLDFWLLENVDFGYWEI